MSRQGRKKAGSRETQWESQGNLLTQRETMMRTLAIVAIGIASLHVAAGPEQAPAPRPAAIRAPSLDGGTFVWPPGKGDGSACLFFVGVDCPIANAYSPEIARIVNEYRKRDVAFAVVYPVPDLTANEAKKHAKEYGFDCPALLDSRLHIARRLGATVTPETVVLSASCEVVYRGRIDDRYTKVGGKRRENPSTRELRDALYAQLAGKAIASPWPRAIGCDIDFER
ncbi:MAG: hypothetical protein C0467_07000 [Planctomycetaceae bacterium]|nr:hypothetical protein [Planctomycetaceae bacterium]